MTFIRQNYFCFLIYFIYASMWRLPVIKLLRIDDEQLLLYFSIFEFLLWTVYIVHSYAIGLPHLPLLSRAQTLFVYGLPAVSLVLIVAANVYVAHSMRLLISNLQLMRETIPRLPNETAAPLQAQSKEYARQGAWIIVKAIITSGYVCVVMLLAIFTGLIRSRRNKPSIVTAHNSR